MASGDNLFEVVEQLREIVADLKRTLYGDHATRATGLLAEFDALRRRVESVEEDVERIRSKRPNVGSWVTAYVLFCVAMVFLAAGMINLFVGHDALGLEPAVAFWLSAAAVVVAGVLFAVGYSWLDRG
jgi:hypothetical protein